MTNGDIRYLDVLKQQYPIIFSADIRKTAADTDNGCLLDMQVADLEALLAAYRSGRIAENGE